MSCGVIVTGSGPFSRKSKIFSMPVLNCPARLSHWPATDVTTYVSSPPSTRKADRSARPVARPRGMILAYQSVTGLRTEVMTRARKTAMKTICTWDVAKKTRPTAATSSRIRHDQPALVRNQAGTESSTPTTDGLRRAPATFLAAGLSPARCLTDAAGRSAPPPELGAVAPSGPASLSSATSTPSAVGPTVKPPLTCTDRCDGSRDAPQSAPRAGCTLGARNVLCFSPQGPRRERRDLTPVRVAEWQTR